MDAPLKSSSSRFRYRRCGVYDLAYEDASPPFILRLHSLLHDFRAICDKIPRTLKIITDAIKLAPANFIAYMVTTVWRGIYSAVNLYWLSILLNRLGDSIMLNSIMPPEVYRSLVISWISCVMINVAAERLHAQSLEVLTKQFRARFIPQLIRASLRVDLLSIQDLYSVFPIEGRFESEFPGGLFLKQLSRLVQCTLGLFSQVFVLIHVVSSKPSPEREILLCLCVARGFFRWLAPWNVIYLSGYVYWSRNRHFQRMKSLFGLAFSAQYRADLVLDGAASSIEAEYMKSAEKLGDVEILDPTPWHTAIRQHWYWDFLADTMLDLPQAIYVLVFPTYLSPSFIISMALLQLANKAILRSMGRLRGDAPTLLEVCSHAKRLYDAINYCSAIPQGTEPYPRPNDQSSVAGMKISFRHVSLRYPGSDHDALDDVSFDIAPGELVLIVGTNGSGKSTLLKLLARLFDPTAGQVRIDDVPLVRYDADQVRAAMAFQSQAPVVYPLSVRDNIHVHGETGIGRGFPWDGDRDGDKDRDGKRVEVAARGGGCTEWIARLGEGYDALLEPSFDIYRGWIDGMWGYPSAALQDELARQRGRRVALSAGEKQRLATARTLMRLHDSDRPKIRLLVVDEATSALDPIAERDIWTRFLNERAGKTIVVVTHRFGAMAAHADRILCMKDGRIVENGTHAQLLRIGGDYAAMYHAQVDRP